MKVQVKNCNSIYEGEIDIVENALNIKYAINGTGKSTMAKAICAAIESDDNALRALKPYAFLDKPEEECKPQIEGADAFRSVMIFNEEYVEQYVFKPDELIEDSFSIFIKTPDYDKHMQEIQTLLIQINESFKAHPELEELIQVFGQFIDAFGKTKNGISKSGALYKSFGEGNKIRNVPKGLESYSPYLTHVEDSQNVKWIKWQMQGEPFLDIADQCPYCTGSIDTSKERILQVKKEYDSKSIEHLNKMLQIFEILQPYFSDNTVNEIKKITNNISGITKQQQDYLSGIRQQVESLLEALKTLKGIGFHSLKNAEKIADEINGYTINLSYYPHFQAVAMQQKVEVINQSLSEVLKKANLLQGEINQQKYLINKTVKDHSNRINGFLATAGYQYEVVLIEDKKDNQLKLHLKPIHCVNKVDNVQDHLSYGERNAFALVLFMFSVLKKNPDLVILDDPISSFDGNKKFAILNMLFLAKGACLRNRTVLLLTHEFNTVIDVIYTKPCDFQPKPHAAFLSVNNHVLTEKTIEKSDILTFIGLTYWNLNDPTLPIINKLIFFRRWLEAEGDKNAAWHFLSSLFHRRAKPTKKGNGEPDSVISEDANENSLRTSTTETESEGDVDIELNQSELSSVFELFDDKMHIDIHSYEELFNQVNDDANLIQLYKSSVSNYEKLQIYRLIFQSHDNAVIKKFINESYHCENDYLFQLNPRKYDTVPQYIIDECDKNILEKEEALLNGQ